MSLPKCCYCYNFRLDDMLISPTDVPEPHICGACSRCPYPDAYGNIDNVEGLDLGIWINLVTMKCWVDGSCDVKDDCPNFKKSELIYTD